MLQKTISLIYVLYTTYRVYIELIFRCVISFQTTYNPKNKRIYILDKKYIMTNNFIKVSMDKNSEIEEFLKSLNIKFIMRENHIEFGNNINLKTKNEILDFCNDRKVDIYSGEPKKNNSNLILKFIF